MAPIAWCYTWSVPTIRPRHVITETDELAHALDAAAARWPEIAGNRTALLKRMIREATEELARGEAARIAERNTTIATLAGSLTGAWPAGLRDELRNEWPE